MANKHVYGIQAMQDIQLAKQQEELFATKGAQSRLASQLNKVLGENESLEAHVAALEVQRDNMLHELQAAALLQVMPNITKLTKIVATMCSHMVARLVSKSQCM